MFWYLNLARTTKRKHLVIYVAVLMNNWATIEDNQITFKFRTTNLAPLNFNRLNRLQLKHYKFIIENQKDFYYKIKLVIDWNGLILMFKV